MWDDGGQERELGAGERLPVVVLRSNKSCRGQVKGHSQLAATMPKCTVSLNSYCWPRAPAAPLAPDRLHCAETPGHWAASGESWPEYAGCLLREAKGRSGAGHPPPLRYHTSFQ